MLKFYLLLFLSTINLITYAEIHVDSIYAELIRQEVPHPHIVLKQAKLESGNFKSKLTKTHNNILGIKQGKKYKKYTHYSECITDYKKRISNRYKGGDYYQFLKRIKYANNSAYIKLLKKL